MHERSALNAGEHGAVQILGVFFLAQDQAAPGSAQGLVGGRGDEISVGDGAGVMTRGHEAGDVGHIHHHERTDLVANGAEGREVEDAGVGGGAHHDHLGLVLPGQVPDLVHVHALGVLANLVAHELVEDARAVQGVPVGEVTSVG